MSTSFFNFYSAPSITSVVTPRFWIFWAINLPVTLLVVGLWYLWERQRLKRHEVFDRLLDQGVDAEKMEGDILSKMRKGTVTRASTWDGPSRAAAQSSTSFKQ